MSTLLLAIANMALAAAAKLSAEMAVLAAAPGAAGIAGSVGDLAKDIVQELLKATSNTEALVDALVREPLQSGLRLLEDGVSHPLCSTAERQSRDELLGQAYAKLVEAASLSGASHEDVLWIQCVQCLALAARSGRTALAFRLAARIRSELAIAEGSARAAIERAERRQRIGELAESSEIGLAELGCRRHGQWVETYMTASERQAAVAVLERCAALSAIVTLAEVMARAA